MSLIKKISFVFLIICTCSIASAQTENKSSEKSIANKSSVTPKSSKKNSSRLKSWSIGISNLQWNEDLQLQQGLQTSNDVANLNGFALSAHKDTSYNTWGWNFGFLLGMGKASGGGNSSSVVYAERVNFSLLGVAPRAYYKLSGRINVGLSAIAFIKNVDWPTANGVSARSRGSTNFTTLFDLNIRLNPRLDFYSGMGPLSEGSTLWRLGLVYRL